MIATIDSPGLRFDAGSVGIVNPSNRRGGTLRLVSSSDVDSLDPARTYYVWSWLLQRMFQRTVMAFAGGRQPAGPGVVPDLAVAPGEPSDGGTTWTYRLRQGARFEDGTPVTAHDVRYAIERVFAQDVLPGGPTQLIGLLDDPADPYPGPYRDGGCGLPAIRTPDDHTLVFRLRRPFADFDYLMALPNTAPVPRASDTGAAYELRPLASGPYVVADYRPGARIVWRRNPAWSSTDDPLRPALPDVVDVTLGVEVNEMDDRLIAGDFHLDVEGRGIQHAAAERIMGNPALARHADNPVTGFLQYISIQQCVPPFDDVHCRRAVQYAADKVALQIARGGPVTGGDIATTVLPPTYPGHRAFDRYPSGADRRGDLDAARRELELAGLPDGFETVIGTQRGKFTLVAEALRDSLARVGIAARVEQLDVESYYRSGIGDPATIMSRGLGLAVTDWGADFPTEYGFLGPLVDGRQIKRAGGNFNVAELDDSAVNALIDRALAAPDPVARADIWHEVDRRVMDAAVILPLVYDKTLHYRDPRVTNVYVHPAFGLYDVMAMGLAE